ncbi:hypothetical protein QE450_002055 [Paenibacillus sp. SORGH_AS306]|uniref:restriction endonuclease n=1 Tax=unclassified Paenibacillus TaxID=185978 RepID=UPI00277D34ED|nr:MULTISPECIES: restriction endonuclease [unclassified Paenibacillus]MDQ1234557.1 hypothetical protein [Paenibacillus sp. SORGH_AS_0306]MDR6111603.1 hypothetical protein [Paenibacillus sp. SORGH_AS_0338]
MIIEITDYNRASNIIQNSFQSEWNDILKTITKMPLHLKASDQKGKQGAPIFDAIGTNLYIKNGLVQRGWLNNIPIPKKYDFLGKDIDFGKRGMLIEVQFSNYPFLLNNTIRSELFYKSGMNIDSAPMKIAVIVTKAHMFPSSNSTLYYEQAKKQLDELSSNDVFDVPIRLVGFFENYDTSLEILYTTYSELRYSRTIGTQEYRSCKILSTRKNSMSSIIID